MQTEWVRKKKAYFSTVRQSGNAGHASFARCRLRQTAARRGRSLRTARLFARPRPALCATAGNGVATACQKVCTQGRFFIPACQKAYTAPGKSNPPFSPGKKHGGAHAGSSPITLTRPARIHRRRSLPIRTRSGTKGGALFRFVPWTKKYGNPPSTPPAGSVFARVRLRQRTQRKHFRATRPFQPGCPEHQRFT